MSVQSRTSVSLIDDGDKASITVEERDDAEELERWTVSPSGGGTTLFVSSADLLEFANALRDLAQAAEPSPFVDLGPT